MIPSHKQFLETLPLIRNAVHNTPVLTSQTLDTMTGTSLFFKCENFQKMGAFKMRGASHAIARLTDAQRAKGVATHSSGNFAQAVALSAQNRDIPATIVMPENAPAVKKAAVRGYGATIIECESNPQAREAALDELVARTGMTPLHPSNDVDVILGQGTAAQELLAEISNLDAIVAPVGGGGLLGGTALAAHYLSPTTKVYGAEPFGADDAYRSFHSGEIVLMTHPQTIADGLRTNLGDNNFPIIQQHITEIIRVEEDEIVSAMRLVWERMKIVIEPSSSVALAAILKEPDTFAGQRIGVIISGGNVDVGNLPW